MTVVATVTDVNTPSNTIILTSVDASQNIVITFNSGADTGTVDGDVLAAALQGATFAPSGKEAYYQAAITSEASVGYDAIITSETTTEEVTITVNATARRVNAEELRKAIQNVIND